MTFTHYFTAPDDEGRQYAFGFDEWKPYTITFKPYLTPREDIPAAFRGQPAARADAAVAAGTAVVTSTGEHGRRSPAVTTVSSDQA